MYEIAVEHHQSTILAHLCNLQKILVNRRETGYDTCETSTSIDLGTVLYNLKELSVKGARLAMILMVQ